MSEQKDFACMHKKKISMSILFVAVSESIEISPRRELGM